MPRALPRVQPEAPITRTLRYLECTNWANKGKKELRDLPRATEGSDQVVFRSFVHSPVPQALREPQQTNPQGAVG